MHLTGSPVSLFASSTAIFDLASSTAASTTRLTTGAQWFTSLTNSGLGVDANGKVYAAATSTLANISGTLALTQLANQNPNTVLANGTAGSAAPTAISTTSLFAGINGQVLAFANGNWTGVATTTFSSGLTYANGSVTCDTASGSILDCLSSTDWNTFNNKQAALTFTYPLQNNTNTISLAFGTTTTNTWTHQIFSSLFATNASSTNATTTNLYITGLANSGLGVDANGKVYAAATSTLANISGTLALTQLATQNPNTVLANVTGATAAPTAISATSLFAGFNGQVLAFSNGAWTGVGTTTNSCSSGIACTFSAGTWSFTDTYGYPFASNTTFATTTAATTTSIWTQGVFFASSTAAASQLPYASSTAFTASGSAWFATDAGSKVGIGTMNPLGALQLGSTTVLQTVTTNQSFIGNNAYYDSGQVSPGAWKYINSAAGSAIRFSPQLNGTAGDIGFYTWDSGTAGTTIGTMDTTGAKMEITNAGSVGIGTTSPWALLSINPNGITGPSFAIGSSTKTDFIVTNGGRVGIGTTTPLQKFSVDGVSLFGYGNVGNLGRVNVNFDSLAEQGISIQTNNSSLNGFFVRFHNSAATAIGGISKGGDDTSVAYNTTSDFRLKENIATSTKGLATLMQIHVRDFNFISDPNKMHEQGYIAQELYPIYPEAVSVGGESATSNPWGVDYGRITPLIVKAVQDIANLADALKTKLVAWFADATNGIGDFFAKRGHFQEQLCIGSTCVTGDQLAALLASAGQSAAPTSSPSSGGSSSVPTTPPTLAATTSPETSDAATSSPAVIESIPPIIDSPSVVPEVLPTAQNAPPLTPEEAPEPTLTPTTAPHSTEPTPATTTAPENPAPEPSSCLRRG